MDAILDELEAVPADPEAERQPPATRAETALAWERFLRERGRTETSRTAPRRWRDEEGL